MRCLLFWKQVDLVKYKIDKELRTVSWLKIPVTTKLLPFMNLGMKLFTCKSDARVNVKKEEIAGYQNQKIPVYVIEPKHASGVLPCMVIFHGGGFLLKASDTHYELAKEYAEKLSCKVIYPDYRLAPKYPYPVPVEDCFQTYRWVLENKDSLQIDDSKIVIAGDSAGGNLAAAVTLMARDRGLKMPAGAMLIYPVTDRRMQTDSMKQYTDTPVWDARLSAMMWKAYLGEQEPEPVEYASPLEAETLADFPATYVEVAEFDCLRDEGIAFYERLRESGISAVLHEVKNACHGYERAIQSEMVHTCMERRICWITDVFNKTQTKLK